MNLYNSWLFSKKRYGFSYPLFVTSMHMIVQFALSSAALALFKDIAPRGRNGKRARPNAKDWLSKVVPCALATAIDIGLSNLSLKTITLTFYSECWREAGRANERLNEVSSTNSHVQVFKSGLCTALCIHFSLGGRTAKLDWHHWPHHHWRECIHSPSASS